MAARSPGMLLGAASFALLWGLGWWLAAPAVDTGFANGAPADTAGVIQLWTLTAAILVPMLVMRTVLEPDRTGLIEWRLSGPVRPIGLVVSMLLTTSIALSLFVLPILPIIGVSLLHDASVVTMLGQAVVSVLLLLTWAAVVISTTIWLRSTFLTLLFTLMVPALALGAVAALPLLADRVDDAGLGWLSSALSRLARQLASIHCDCPRGCWMVNWSGHPFLMLAFWQHCLSLLLQRVFDCEPLPARSDCDATLRCEFLE